jgi:hypothetical protein
MLVRPGRSATSPSPGGTPLASFGLSWLWQYLEDIPRPQLLDCGPLHASTVRILLARCGKVYRGDIISPLERHEPMLWDRSGKSPLFLTDLLLDYLPEVSTGSLSVIFSWQVFDLVPRDAIAGLVLHFHSLLEPGGVLFCLLREPRLDKGADADWQLDSLTEMARPRDGVKPFAYPALSNRDLDRLIPTGSVKTFLTRSGWREVLVVK